ncbi:MAG TPA: D-2-hydroxyacid dehydrogenase [Candidatus Polarisedimenticolia bacterium]|nr:D-2-hydroxyacid dehydrogenase [Candidatus Polarisedimenticolia bacterium]
MAYSNRIMLPAKDRLTLCFAHAAYRLQERFLLRGTGMNCFEIRSLDDLERRLPEADVLVVSGLWRNTLLDKAPRLGFIQSISAGIDQYDTAALKARGISLASAQGANAAAVSEHAMALILALTRRLLEARDNQARHHWRPMMGEFARREDELSGKTLLVVGYGRIGQRLGKLAKAFDLRVIGVRRDVASGGAHTDAVHAIGDLPTLLPQADIVALTCPLTPETQGLIGASALAAMKPDALLINVARGRCVDEAALIGALEQGRLAGAGLDCFAEEPLPVDSPLWDFPHVLITPHTAGETRRYEDNVLDLLVENLDRLWSNRLPLKNQVV